MKRVLIVGALSQVMIKVMREAFVEYAVADVNWSPKHDRRGAPYNQGPRDKYGRLR